MRDNDSMFVQQIRKMSWQILFEAMFTDGNCSKKPHIVGGGFEGRRFVCW